METRVASSTPPKVSEQATEWHPQPNKPPVNASHRRPGPGRDTQTPWTRQGARPQTLAKGLSSDLLTLGLREQASLWAQHGAKNSTLFRRKCVYRAPLLNTPHSTSPTSTHPLH